VYKLTPKALVTIQTRHRQAERCSAAELRRGDRTVFYTPNSEATLPAVQVDFFREVQDPDGEYRAGREIVDSTVDFKTPVNLVIATGTPERKFIRNLCARENSKALDAWLKNAPQRFYWVEYAWKKGEHPKRAEFSPDVFIKKGDLMFVVEIKGDEELAEVSIENQKKYEYAKRHCGLLNEWLAKSGSSTRYQLNFITPRDFNKFFQKMRDGDLGGFRSELDLVLGDGSAGSV
jgi:type III restriction enzyme